MIKETRHVYLFRAHGGPDKYYPYYDDALSNPLYDNFYVSYLQCKYIDMVGKRLVFSCKRVKTEEEEKRLRSYDVLCAGPGKFIFVNDMILDCLEHLIDKDIQVLPAEIYTVNGLVEGYHLINVINTVSGVDKTRSTYGKLTGYLDKLVPKNEDFMEGHEIACEEELCGKIYIVPSLREKILKSKKGKLKGLKMITAKELWEATHNIEKCPY